MKKTRTIIKSAILASAALLAASCQDWLTIYPQTQIVEENFWEDKNDLEGVRFSTYKNMCGTLEKIVLWGDLRSDTYDLSAEDQSTYMRNFYRRVREGQMDKDSANAYFEWGDFYTTINYCNKVLQHGEQVMELDKQFTTSEWIQMKAEMTTLRAMNYFYLLRTFKDIPYSNQVINKDTEVKYFGATNQLVVLDSLILDVESVQGQARVRFAKLKESKGMITNCAIYALLSDMYLWRASLHQGRDIKEDTVMVRNVEPSTRIRNLVQVNDSVYVPHTVEGDYKLAIAYADLSLESLARQNLEARRSSGAADLETRDYGLTNCDMYRNKFEGFMDGNAPQLLAYNAIFTEGNSDESIFELQFSSDDNRSNNVVTTQWGYSNRVHLSMANNALSAIYSDDKERTRDSRTWFSAWDKTTTQILPEPFCFKWQGISVQKASGSNECQNITIRTATEGNNYRNWIVYRMSDMMLQKAEAHAALAAMNIDKTANNAAAMRYVNAIHRRWYCNDRTDVTSQPSTDVNNSAGEANDNTVTGSSTGKMGNAPKAADVETAVFNERQLEFMGEGKRWFDLVRYAERYAGGKDGTKDPREYSPENPIGSGKAGVDKMIEKFMGPNSVYSEVYTTLKNRFKNRYGLYNIIHYMEIKASVDEKGVQHLEQNPVWNKSKYD